MVAVPSSTASVAAPADEAPSGGRSAALPAALLVTTLLAAALVVFFFPRLAIPVRAGQVPRAVPAFALGFGLATAAIALLRRHGRDEIRTFGRSAALRAAVAVALGFSFQFDDEIGLHGSASVGASGGGYVKVLTSLYSTFGANLFVAKGLNVLLGSLLVVIVGDLVRPGDRRFAQALALTCPPLVIYAAVNLKETSTALLIVGGFALVVRALRQETGIARAVAGSFAIGGALLYMRGSAWAALAATALCGGLALELLASRRGRDRRRLLLVIPALLIAVAVAGPSLSQSVRTEYVDQRVGARRSTSYYVDRTYATGSGVTGYLDTSDPLGARNLLVLWGRGLFVPSPFRALTDPSPARTVELAGTIGWYVMLIAATAGAARTWRTRGTSFLIGSALLLSFSTAALSTLGADPARHRLVVIPLLCALAAPMRTRDRSSEPAKIAPFVALGGAVLYNALWVVAFVRGGVGA